MNGVYRNGFIVAAQNRLEGSDDAQGRVGRIVSTVAAVAALLAGCTSFKLQGKSTDVRVVECSMAQACPQGAVCALGYCASGDLTSAPTVDVQLLPPSASGYLRPQQIIAVALASLSSPAIPDWVAETPLQMSGTINPPPDGPLSFIAVRVEAERAGAIPGTAVRFGTTVQRYDAGAWVYSLPLWDGSYSFTMTPDDATIPPLIVANVSVPAMAAGDFSFPRQSDLAVIRGRVVTSPAELRPIVGVEVMALDLNGRVRSTVATTDADGGFSIRWAGDASVATLSARPTAGSGTVPAVEVGPFNFAGAVDIGAIDVGALGAAGMNIVRVASADGGLLEGARVRCVGLVGNGTVATTGTTNAYGEWAVPLYAGTYDVTAVGAASTSKGSMRAKLVAMDGGALAITLPEKVGAKVVVSDSAGALVAGASVTFRRTGEVDADAAAWIIDEVTVATGGDGVAAVSVDVGRFDVIVTPSQLTGLPRGMVRNRLIADGGAVVAVQLAVGVRLAGRIVGGAGAVPIAGVAVEFYARSADAGTGTGSALPALLGSTLTASDGTFAVVLPRDY